MLLDAFLTCSQNIACFAAFVAHNGGKEGVESRDLASREKPTHGVLCLRRHHAVLAMSPNQRAFFPVHPPFYRFQFEKT